MNITIFSLREMRQAFAALAIFALVLLSAQGIFSPQVAQAAEPLHNSVSISQWSDDNSNWITGILQANNSTYKEGEVVPFELDLTGNNVDVGEQYVFSICRNYEDGAVRGYLNLQPYNTSRNPVIPEAITSTMGPLSGANVTIDSVNEVGGQGACSADHLQTIVTVTVDGEEAYVYWGGYLASPLDVGDGNSASNFSGGSLHMRLLAPSKDLPIKPSDIIPVIPGCTDPLASNYDPAATDDDGSCLYPDPEATLTLVKSVVNQFGTPAAASEWTLEADGSVDDISGISGAFEIVVPGAYTLSETGGPVIDGDVGAYEQTSLVCDKDGALNGSVVTLVDGDDVTCTFTNTFVPADSATLTVVKTLIQDNGGVEDYSDFSFTVNGTEYTWDVGNDTKTIVIPESELGIYDVAEVIDSVITGRYAVSYDNCDDLDLSANGDEETCTITNNDITPQLTVIKQVVDSALPGDKNPADFTMTVTGTDVSDDSFGGSEVGVTVTLDAGAYSVSELDTFGYAKDDSDLDCSGSIDLGESKTCTIINTEPDPTTMTVTFDKVVSSGDALPSEWTFEVVGGNVDETIDEGDSIELPEGTYTVTEVGPNGYRQVSRGGVCTDAGQLDGTGQIAVDVDDLGTGGTCTFTNEIIPLSSITIDKVVTGYKANEDLGFSFTSIGTGTENFQLSHNSDVKVFSDLSAGEFSFTETDGGSRWELTDISCVGMDENRSAEDEANGIVTLDLEEGEHVTCTFTNDYTDDLGTDDERITVRKEVTQGSDTEVLFDFVLTNLDTLATTSFELAHGNEFESNDLSTAATFSVTESMPDQFWSQDSVACTSDDNDGQINPNSIELADGENVLCVFTNDQMLFEIYGYVWEDTDEDGVFDEDESALIDWDVHATNGSKNFSTVSGEGGFYSFMVPAGTWTISETVQSGWDQTFPFPEDEGVHVVTVPQPEESESAFLDSVKSFFIATAHAQQQIWQSRYGEYNFGNVREPSDGGGGGSGGSTAPRCDMFEAEVDGDEIVLTWETRRGTDLVINADGDEIFSTDEDDEIDEGSLTVDNDGQEEFELVVSRGSREDECAVNIDRPEPLVLGDQVSAVPLGAANTGAGGTSPVQTPQVPFATLVGALSLRRNG